MKYDADDEKYFNCRMPYYKDNSNKKSKSKFRKNNTVLEDWIIHIDQYGLEYITGYIHSKKKDWETSTIKERIALSDSLLIVTENESIYILPYSEKHVY